MEHNTGGDGGLIALPLDGGSSDDNHDGGAAGSVGDVDDMDPGNQQDSRMPTY